MKQMCELINLTFFKTFYVIFLTKMKKINLPKK